MATSVFMGRCSDLENTRREMEISLMNGSIEKPTRIQTGKPGGGGRRKSKLSESSHQKKKLPQRGMGVEQLERLRIQERMKKMTEINPLHPLSFQNNHFATVPTPAFGAYTIRNNGSTGVGLGHEGFDIQQPALLLQEFGNGSGFHGPVVSSGFGPLFSDETFLADPFAVGSGFRTARNGIEALKELSSIPNNVKWNSEHCCSKKLRGNGVNIICKGERKMCGEMSPVNGIGNFGVGNKGNMFNGVNPYYGSQPKGEEVEVMAVHRKGNAGGGSLLMEYEFFPGKVGGNYTELMNLASLKAEASMTSTVDQALIGGGSLVGEEASDHRFHGGVVEGGSNSIDLTLKLSY